MDRSVAAPLFLVLFVAVASAATLPQDYWKKVLPTTPMPGAVRDLLRPDVLDEKGGAHVDAGKGTPGGTPVDGNKGVVVVPGYPKPPVVVVVPGYGHPYWHPYWYPYYYHPGPFLYKYAATETQVRDNPNVALFFLEKDLYPGAKMKLHFTRTTPMAAFMPRAVADAVPFSSKKLPEILTRFSHQPNSMEAQAMKKTLQECEEPAAAGETRRCATSLESMVDFATSTLGTRNVRAVSTEVDRESAPKQQYYTVASSGVQTVLAGGKSVACHAQPYPYAVFYCHATTGTTKAYVVPLVGEDGGKVAAVAVCHTDTSAWNPGHLAFRVLKVKPGTVPICHFLPQDHVVWAPRK